MICMLLGRSVPWSSDRLWISFQWNQLKIYCSDRRAVQNIWLFRKGSLGVNFFSVMKQALASWYEAVMF